MTTNTTPLPQASREEILSLIERDGSFISGILAGMREGLTAEQMAERLGHKNSRNVQDFVYSIRVLVGDAPLQPGKNTSKQAYYAARRYLKLPVSKPTEDHFAGIIRGFVGGSGDLKPTNTVDVPGVYVFSYPHYLKHPVSPEDGRTLMKVGCSTGSARVLHPSGWRGIAFHLYHFV
mgnify:CR=1 FL=1